MSNIFMQKTFSFLIFVAVASSYVTAGFFTPECTTFGVSCLDCYTQKLCWGGSIWSNTSCQGAAASNPNMYCNPTTAQCISTPPPGCAAKRDVKCLRANGVFPDLNNCGRYNKCEDDFPRTLECPSKYVYNQTLGKCVYKMENSDCVQVTCGIMSSVHLYPGDTSLYYQCTAGLPKLSACAENYVYDVTSKTCQSICRSSGLLANPKNCSEYISCEATGSSYVATKKSCSPGYGFDPVRGGCQKGLDRLCFEIATFDHALANFNFLPSIVKNIIAQVKDLLFGFNIDYAFLLKVGVPANIMSAVLLIGDYALRHRLMLPPLVLNDIMEFIVSLLPPNLKAGANLIMSVALGRSLF